MLKDVDLSILGEIPSLPVDLVMSSPAMSSKTDSSCRAQKFSRAGGSDKENHRQQCRIQDLGQIS